jgi:xanthine dehydrogenase accessory factor
MHAPLFESDVSVTKGTTPLGGMRALIAGLRELVARDAAGAVAVVVGTTGSTYRKPGALILLDVDGVRVGALSGGCLEADLEARARAVLATGVAQEARFDTSGDEDRVFGSGTGCGGSTHVVVVPVPARGSPLRDALLEAEESGLVLTLQLALAPERLGSGAARCGAALHGFDQRGKALTEWPADDPTVELTLAPGRRLLLLGAGPETRPLLALTRLLGWHVELVEHRERWLRFAAGCDVDHLHREGPDLLPQLLEHARFDAALVMNHNVHLDARCLRHLAAGDVAYVGLLGPAARRDDLLAEVGAEVSEQLRTRLRAPVGLALGGEGAEAIALAIVAQLQSEFARDARR